MISAVYNVSLPIFRLRLLLRYLQTNYQLLDCVFRNSACYQVAYVSPRR